VSAAVSEDFIALLNLPVQTLQQLAKELGVETPSQATQWELAGLLSDFPRTKLESVAGRWLYAGSTSVTWFQLGDGEAIDPEAFRAAVTEVVGADPYEEDVRPDKVTNRPDLVAITDLDDNKIVLTFVVAKRVTRVIHNFESHTVYADEFFVAVVRLNQGVVEVRASHDRARLLARTWLGELAEKLG
jgi:hypothetical protein